MAYRVQYETFDKRWVDFSGELPVPHCATAIERFERLFPGVRFRIHGTLSSRSRATTPLPGSERENMKTTGVRRKWHR